MRRVLLILCGMLALAPQAASAHPDLATSRPAAGEIVPGGLSELTLSFTERVELRYTTLVVITAAGDTIRGGVTFEGTENRSVRFTLNASLASGVYRVVWRTAGADGHVVGGEYGFSVGGAPARTQVLVPPESDLAAHHADADPGRDVNQRPIAVLVRWLNLTFVVLLGGGIAFPFLLGDVPRRSPLSATRTAGRRIRRMTLIAVSVVLILAILRLELQSAMVHGREQAWNFALVAPLIGRTAWGRAWVIQLVGAGLVGLAVAPRANRGWLKALSACGFVLLAVGMALGGHAATVESSLVPAWAIDALHVVAASLWLGSLAYVLAVALPIALSARIDDDLARVVRRFSKLALVAAPLVVLTGGTSALLHLVRLEDLWLSDYGRLLALKVAGVGFIAATGFYNWRRVVPTLGTSEASRRLRLSAAVEIGLALLVLAVTAFLVATQPPVGVADAISHSLPGRP
jgi:copper transport protein